MRRREWLGVTLASAVAPFAARAQSGELVVFAAASLKNALDEIASAWTKDTGKPKPRISYAARSALAKQIEQGAPADLFLSADTDWMDYVDKKDLIRKDTRINLLGNKIVLIAPRDSAANVELKPGLELARTFAAHVASSPRVAEWERLMKSLQQPPPGAAPGEWWSAMEPVFTLNGDEPAPIGAARRADQSRNS